MPLAVAGGSERRFGRSTAAMGQRKKPGAVWPRAFGLSRRCLLALCVVHHLDTTVSVGASAASGQQQQAVRAHNITILIFYLAAARRVKGPPARGSDIPSVEAPFREVVPSGNLRRRTSHSPLYWGLFFLRRRLLGVETLRASVSLSARGRGGGSGPADRQGNGALPRDVVPSRPVLTAGDRYTGRRHGNDGSRQRGGVARRGGGAGAVSRRRHVGAGEGGRLAGDRCRPRGRCDPARRVDGPGIRDPVSVRGARDTRLRGASPVAPLLARRSARRDEGVRQPHRRVHRQRRADRGLGEPRCSGWWRCPPRGCCTTPEPEKARGSAKATTRRCACGRPCPARPIRYASSRAGPTRAPPSRRSSSR